MGANQAFGANYLSTGSVTEASGGQVGGKEFSTTTVTTNTGLPLVYNVQGFTDFLNTKSAERGKDRG